MIKEFYRIHSRLRERGIFYYFIYPNHLKKYGYYVLQTLKRRWPRMADVIYILDMPLSSRVLNSNIVAHCFRSLEPLLNFAKEREREETGWGDGGYVKELEQRFSKGDWCFAAEYNKKIVSVIFVSVGTGYLSPVGYTLNIPQHTVGLYDVYTLSQYRGRNLYSAVFNRCVNSCFEQGFRKAWMWIMPQNTVSLKTHLKMGMRHIFFEVRIYQRWGFRWHKTRALDIDVEDILKECQIPSVR